MRVLKAAGPGFAHLMAYSLAISVSEDAPLRRMQSIWAHGDIETSLLTAGDRFSSFELLQDIQVRMPLILTQGLSRGAELSES